jgi:hypothetical protein
MVNKNRNILIMLLTFVSFLSGCSTVSTNLDRSANLSSYKTYAWREPDIKTDNPVYKSELVERELSKHGLWHNQQNPDLYVVYHTYVENVQRTYGNYYSGFGFYGYPYSGYYGYPYGFSPYGFGPSTYNAVEGTLVIDFMDSHTNKLVWRGSIKDDVSNVSKIEETLEKDVHAILKKYPGTKENM